jgi:hypothetical protein
MIAWHGARVAKDSHKQLGDEYWENALTLPQIVLNMWLVLINSKKKILLQHIYTCAKTLICTLLVSKWSRFTEIIVEWNVATGKLQFSFLFLPFSLLNSYFFFIYFIYSSCLEFYVWTKSFLECAMCMHL